MTPEISGNEKENTMPTEYYRFQDGSVIEDEKLSALMVELVKLAPDKSSQYTWDDIGTATLMSDLYADTLRYCPQNDCWYLWHL